MTEQVTGQDPLLWARIAEASYDDVLDARITAPISEAGFTHIAPSTPNYVEFVEDQGGASVYVHDGFNGQAFISNDRNTLVIGLRGSDSFADWVQHLSSGGVVFNGATHPQLASAREYVAQMMAQYPNANVVFSGHSAGAYLGTILGYEYPNATVVALNAPGINLSFFGGQNDNVYYVYSEVWGIVGGPIHSVGDFASDNVLFVPNTSGHGMVDLISGLGKGGVRLISLEDVQDRAVAFHTIHDARLIASQTGVSFAEVVSHQLIEAINGDRQLLNSDAFKSMVSELLGEHLTDADAAHVWGEVVHETNGQCFPAGTLISMAIGTQRRIEDIRAGDVVLSFDPATGDHLPRAVTKVYRGETDVWFNLTYTQNGVVKSLASTPEHPFLTKGGSFAPILHVVTAYSTDEMPDCFLPTSVMIRAHHV